jgi:hypothetical protein
MNYGKYPHFVTWDWYLIQDFDTITEYFRYLRYCLDRNIIKPTIMPLAIAMIVANPLGTLNAWRFIRNHWIEIETS